MNFLHKNNCMFNILLAISIVLDIGAGIVSNWVAEDVFSLKDTHDMVILLILCALVAALIILKILENYYVTHIRKREIQAVFKRDGGFEVITEEIKKSIKDHDFATVRELKQIADIFEE